MKTVTRREFIQHTSLYMKELPMVITNRGENDLVLCSYDSFVKPPTQSFKNVATVEQLATHGCGCIKDGTVLCKKHRRM